MLPEINVCVRRRMVLDRIIIESPRISLLSLPSLSECTTTLGSFMKALYFLDRLFGHFTIGLLSYETSKVVERRRNNPEVREPFETGRASRHQNETYIG